MAVPKVLAGGLQLLLNFFLLRYFGPEYFGAISVCVTMILLVDAITGAAVDMGVVRLAPAYRSTDPAHGLRIQQAALLGKPIALLFLLLPLLIARDQVAGLLFDGREVASGLLVVTITAVLGLAILRSIQTHLQVEGNFRAYGMADVILNAIRYGGVGILLWTAVATPWRVLSLYAIAPFAASAVTFLTSGRKLFTLRIDRTALSELIATVKWYAGATAVGSFITRMDLLMVSTYAGVREAGIFSAAQVLTLVPQLIGMYMGVVFGPKIMPLYRENRLAPVYRRIQVALVIVCGVLMIVAWAGAAPLGDLLLPAAYDGATQVFLLLLPSALCSLLNFPWTVSLLLFLRPRLILLYDLCTLPFLFFAYTWAIREGNALGAAAVTTGFAVAKTIFFQVLGWKLAIARSGGPTEPPPKASF